MMSRLETILQRKNDRYERLQTALASILSQLEGMGALKIILFGSVADGTVDTHSDLDLFVLMPATKTGKEWLDIVYSQVDRRIAADLIVYNIDEWTTQLPTSHFLQHITTGKIVYEATA